MSGRLRVLAIHHYPAFGGPLNEAVILEPYLRERGVRTTVAITDEVTPPVLQRVSAAVDVVPLLLDRVHATRDLRSHLRTAARLPADVWRIARLIERTRADVIRVHGAQNPHGAIAARIVGRPLVWVLSSALETYPPAFRMIGGELVSTLADSILVNGSALFHAYPGLQRGRSRAVVYVPPVDPVRFAPGEDIRAAKLAVGFDPAHPIVGLVGNVTPIKGVDRFLEIAAMVALDIPAARFVIAGARSERHREYWASVVARGQRPDLAGRVTFLGYRADTEACLRALDVLVISSRTEGTTTVAGEAMASGVPVVSLDVGSVRDVVEHGITGSVVGRHDLRAAALAVSEILASVQLRESLGSQARARALTLFSPDRIADLQAAATWRAFDGRSSAPRR